MRRGLSPLILTLVLIGALSGCATAGSGAAVGETLDVYGAKAVAQSMENELASYVPTSSAPRDDARRCPSGAGSRTSGLVLLPHYQR